MLTRSLVGSASGNWTIVRRNHSESDSTTVAKDPQATEGLAEPSAPKKQKSIDYLTSDSELPREVGHAILRRLPITDLMRFAQVSKEARVRSYKVLKEPNYLARAILEIKPNIFKSTFVPFLIDRHLYPLAQLWEQVFQCSSLSRRRALFEMLIDHPRVDTQLDILIKTNGKILTVIQHNGIYYNSIGPLNETGVLCDAFKNAFEGEFKDGVPVQGHGTLKNFKGIDLFQGSIIDGKLNGWVEIIASILKNHTFKGLYQGGAPMIGVGVVEDGYGGKFVFSSRGKPKPVQKVIYRNGDICSGPFKWNANNKMTGHFQFNTKSTYFGELEGYRPHGRGVYKDVSGNTFDGEFKDGLPASGQANIKYLDGDQYIGAFRGRKYNGNGVYKDASGSIFDGEFEDGLPTCGQANIQYPDGDQYIGELRDGKQSGQGTLIFRYGTLMGEFQEGQLNGLGILTFHDGYVYTGFFNDGVRDGVFSIQPPDGDSYEVEYKDGKPRNGIFRGYQPDGTVLIKKYQNGQEVLNSESV